MITFILYIAGYIVGFLVGFSIPANIDPIAVGGGFGKFAIQLIVGLVGALIGRVIGALVGLIIDTVSRTNQVRFRRRAYGRSNFMPVVSKTDKERALNSLAARAKRRNQALRSGMTPEETHRLEAEAVEQQRAAAEEQNRNKFRQASQMPPLRWQD